MNNKKVFLSVGSPATQKQELFIQAIERRLRAEGLEPNTVGRSTYPSGAPLKAVESLLNDCVGTVVLALERSYFPEGWEKRGGENENSLSEVRLATPWNQIEAAMSYSRGLPLLVLVEKGLKSEGLLEKGYDWFVQWIEVDEAYLGTPMFNGTLADWKAKLPDKVVTSTNAFEGEAVDGDWTLGDLVKRVKLAHLWGAVGAFLGVLGAAFMLGVQIAPALVH